MSRMGSHDPFGHLKHKLWPKEWSEVKLAIWLLTTKGANCLDFLACRWRVTYHWEALNKGYNFVIDFISIKVLHTKLWAPKVVGVLTLGILGLPLESPGTKWYLGVSPMARHIVYYKREGGGFPQVQVVVSLVSSCLLVARSCTKVPNYALTNLLFGLFGLCE
jgi:hypothetical protein